MPEPVTAEPEAQAPEVVETAPAAEVQPTPEPETVEVDSVREAIRSFEREGAQAPAKPEAEPEPEPEPEEPAPAPAAEDETETEPEKRDPRVRINPKNWDDEQGRRDFAAIDLVNRSRREGKTLTIAQAYEQLFGEAPKPAPAEPAGEKPPAEAAKEPSAEPTEASLQAEIEELETQATKAAEEEFDLGKVRKLDRQIAAKERELERLRARTQTDTQTKQNEAAQAHEAAETESLGRVMQEYPALAEDDNEFVRAVQAEIARKEALMPGFRQRDPEWLEDIAPKIARRLNITPAAAAPVETRPAAPAAKPAAAPPPRAATATPQPPRGATPGVVKRPAAPAARPAPGPAPGTTSPAPAAAAQPTTPVSLDDVRAAMREAERLNATQRTRAA